MSIQYHAADTTNGYDCDLVGGGRTAGAAVSPTVTKIGEVHIGEALAIDVVFTESRSALRQTDRQVEPRGDLRRST